MPGSRAGRYGLRRWLVGLVIIAVALVAGLALAGTFSLLDSWIGHRAAAVLSAFIGVAGAALLWPAFVALRTWSGVPRLETCRRELLLAIAALPTTTDGVGLAECIVDVCRRLLPGRALALLLPDQQSDRFVPVATGGPEAGALRSLALPRRSALARALQREGRPLVVTRWIETPTGSETPGESDTVVALSVRASLVGVLVIGRDGAGRGLSREETLIAREICDQAAGALESAQLYGSLRTAFTELETAQRELLALQRATTAAQSSLNLREVLRNVCNGVVEGMDYHEAIVYLIDPATKAITPASAAGRLLTPGLRPRALTADGKPLRLDLQQPVTRALLQHQITISDNPAESILPYLVDGELFDRRETLHDRTVVNLPLVANGDVVGGMALLTHRRTPAERELDSLRGFAAQAASAIVNARLYEDLREAYNDIRIAQDELLRAERLRTLGELASGVAHDFNNILLAVLTHAQLAKRQTAERPVQHALSVIEQAALDGSEVVRRIQNLARTRHAEARESVDLNVVVRQSLEFAQPGWQTATGDSAEIVVRLEMGTPGHITGTPSELREVLVNLLVNAVHAMPAGGTLTVRTFTKDGHAWAEVQDTGTGMTDEVKQRVFEPFFTTKGSSGSGLGMSIVASIVQRHSGIIEIDSEVGQGTTVAVGFPLTLATESRREQRVMRRVQVREPLCVLVVDDDMRAREALTLALEELGHSVETAADAREALRLFMDGDYNVVFTDLSLGDVSGWEVAQAVKKIRRSTEVVLVTGWAAQIDAEARAAGDVDQVLAKPFTLDDIGIVLDHARQRAAFVRQQATA
jgi:signal transduction histidine kinase/CheY-like chemotaxis protein